MTTTTIYTLVLFLNLILAGSAMAAIERVPGQMSAPMVLFDEGGNILTDGEYDITISITDAGGGGLFSEEQVVLVKDGVANIVIGDGYAVGSGYGAYSGGLTPDVFNSSQEISVEIMVEGQASPQEVTVLGSQPYSFIAQKALSVEDGAVSSTTIKDGSIAEADLSETLKGKIDKLGADLSTESVRMNSVKSSVENVETRVTNTNQTVNALTQTLQTVGLIAPAAEGSSAGGTTDQIGIRLDGSTGMFIGAPYQAGTVNNCGMQITGHTLTIKSASGGSLSSTNPCYVVVRSDTPGVSDIAKFTSDVSAIFGGGSSQIAGNLFGILDKDWSNSMPLFIGVVDNGSTNLFTLSRIPRPETTNAVAGLCQLGGDDCDDQDDMMLLSTGQTLANFLSKPVTQVGWVVGTYATSGGAWTLSLTILTGFNTNYNTNAGFFVFPKAQMGNAADRYFTSANAPTFSKSTASYSIDVNGNVDFYLDLQTATNGTDGAGSDIAIPYKTANVVDVNYFGQLRYGGFPAILQSNSIGKNSSKTSLSYFSTVTTTTPLVNNGWSASSDLLILKCRFRVF
ncbi:MAG: hypothetical protein HQM16_07905 [Deltaproteobacteria bacterium]|nr:hypothetical protein [Deltaproteobacteria bacterium]